MKKRLLTLYPTWLHAIFPLHERIEEKRKNKERRLTRETNRADLRSLRETNPESFFLWICLRAGSGRTAVSVFRGLGIDRYSVPYFSHDKVRIFEMWPRRPQNRTVFQLSRLEWNHRLKSTLDRLEIWVEGPLVMEIISPISAGRCQNGKIMSSYAVASRQKNILFCCCLWLITQKKSSKDGNQGWLLGSKRNLKLDSRRSGEASSLSRQLSNHGG